jgi:hypothetical protein
MDEPGEHELVVKALCDGLGNCVLWDRKNAQIVRDDDELKGITPGFIRREVILFVRENGGTVVEQIRETRPGWRDAYHFYYKVILPVDGFKNGLFVEMRLTGDDDPDFPEVTLVGAHTQRK